MPNKCWSRLAISCACDLLPDQRTRASILQLYHSMDQGTSKEVLRTDSVDKGEETISKALQGSRKKKRDKVSAYERAKKVYEEIQEEKRKERLLRKQEREQRQIATEKYEKTKRKANKMFRKRSKKGQPNLGAQVEILLEKIQQRMK
ncbi:hypothetical protein OESDEN_06925 [Oesophagostomum dentatum]|uniref:rRNA-processing protein FYV7 n=1 Tax=Oesophagostomum dentatum TaxID=61180 RepID=A0A0B1TCW0_OESDE|nr:hypothetical protein OESDEN_06925 [Oesophagostomum dentatum]